MNDFLHTPIGMSPVAIVEDGGGLVTEYQRKAQQYTLEGRRVEIRGSCRSACLIALSVPNVCVSPGAVVKAHHAYETYTGTIRKDVTSQMMDGLPPNIRNAIEPNITVNYSPAATLTYTRLVSLGIPDCRQGKQVRPNKDKSQDTAMEQIIKYFGKN